MPGNTVDYWPGRRRGMRLLRYRYPLLVGSVTEHVARVARLPLVDALGVSGPPPTAEAASAVRARDLLARKDLPGPKVQPAPPVLRVRKVHKDLWARRGRKG